jgi:Zn-dependent metalloprotease
VHYGQGYDNAFWNGEQMVYGDGDGTLFTAFTGPLDVTGHELTHGVTQYTAALDYYGQSGALNESVSDVFGTLIKQHHFGQTSENADWLIGQGLLAPGINGVALRSMKEPGTAYDDPQLGKDPQPAHMDHFVHTYRDNGGVHINSGIPNRAFYLVAAAIGGNAWEKAGKVWYDTLTGGSLSATAEFAAFAAATTATAEQLYGSSSAEAGAVRDAWTGVGVTT